MTVKLLCWQKTLWCETPCHSRVKFEHDKVRMNQSMLGCSDRGEKRMDRRGNSEKLIKTSLHETIKTQKSNQSENTQPDHLPGTHGPMGGFHWPCWQRYLRTTPDPAYFQV